MDIKSIIGAYQAKTYGLDGGGKADRKKPLSADKSAESSERVEISARSAALQNARAQIDALPEVRLEVVEEIRKRIEINDYPLENNMDEALKNMIEKHIVP
ncbi:MAG: flagellar biosynthesis anti-sigma factor FlgM [Chitinivibrionales bacterium]